MADKSTKTGFRGREGSRSAPKPRGRSKDVAGSLSGANVKAGALRLKTAVKANPPHSPSRLSKRETKLLGRINVGLSEPQARRLKWLDDKRWEERLTSAEHAELLCLTDESEQLAVDRAKAVVELARLRGATVQSLMSELGLVVAESG